VNARISRSFEAKGGRWRWNDGCLSFPPGSRFWLIGVFGFGFLLSVIMFSGCGGGGGGTAQAPSTPPPSMPETYAEPGAPSGPRPAPAPAKEEPKVELPENFADWSEEHFKQARKEADDRLLEAVRWLGTEAPDKDRAVEILASLLRKLPPEEAPKPKAPARPAYPGAEGYPGSYPGAEGYPGGYSETYTETYPGYPGPPGAGGPRAQAKANVPLIQAVCDALGTIATPKADEVLREVIEVKFETDHDRAAQQASLEALVGHLNPEREDLLFAILTTPEKFRPLDPKAAPRARPRYRPGAPGGYPGESSEYEVSPPEEYGGGYPGAPGYPGGPGYPGAPGMPATEKPMSALELQEAAFALLRPVASEQFRIRLARHIINPKTPQEDVDLFLPYLLEDDARNLSAQLELYAALAQDPAVRKVVERLALELSSRAMGEVLGIPKEIVDEIHFMAKARPGQPRRGPYESEYGPEYGMESTMPGPEMAPRPQMPSRPTRQESGRPSRFAQEEAGPAAAPGESRPARASQPAIQRIGDLASLDSSLLLMLAGKLWSDQVAAFLEKELGGIRSLKDKPEIVLLASTMPVGRVRTSLSRILRARWEEGPDPLEQAGILESVVFDPAYLLAVKELPRKMPKVSASPGVGGPAGVRPSLGRLRPGRGPGMPGQARPGMPPGGYPPERGMAGPEMPEPGMSEEMGYGPRGYPGTRPGRVIPGAESADPKDRAAMAWMLHSLDILRATADRLYEAARILGGGGFSLSPSEEQQKEGEAVIELPPNSKVLGQYEIDLAQVMAEKIPNFQPDPMRIRFWRLEDTTAPKTILGFFRRKLGEAEVYEQPGLTWMELRQPIPGEGLIRSIDILIDTGSGGEGGGLLGAGRGGTTPAQIDILIIETKPLAAGGAG